MESERHRPTVRVTRPCLVPRKRGSYITEMAVPKADYGIDAPTVVRNLAVAGLTCIAVGFLLRALIVPALPAFGLVLTVMTFGSGL